MEVRELWCPECEVSVRGRFPRCEFCGLPEEQLAFLRLFVSRRGICEKSSGRWGYPIRL